MDNGNGTGVLQGTAAAGTGGTYALQFTATNSLASVVQNFTLNIRDITIPSNGAPLVMGSGPGSTAVVRVISATTDRTLAAYVPAFLGGVQVTLGDIDGDGTVDIVTAAGPGGGPHVRVLSGVDFHDLFSFYAFEPSFSGGVNVALGDIDGDGTPDIIAGSGPGGNPHVRVFSGKDLHELASFLAYVPVVCRWRLRRGGRYRRRRPGRHHHGGGSRIGRQPARPRLQRRGPARARQFLCLCPDLFRRRARRGR